ncbi:MAG: pyridoxal phosphate-dependent aminotransferase [Planctomycetota bacterium]
MPPFPQLSPHTQELRPSPFAAFAARLGELVLDPDFVPLHLGDTYPLPPAAALGVDLTQPALHRYGPTAGDAALRAAGAEDLTRLGLPWADPAGTFVTPGATGALDIALDALLREGDEVLVLTPTWPVIWGLFARRGVRARQVPVSASGRLGTPDDLVARLEDALARCERPPAALSLCNPNNPAGFVLSRAHLSALAELCARRALWLLYDAVYTDLCLDSAARPLAWLPPELAPRTCVTTSYSKSFGLAGHRVGLLAVPPALAPLVPRIQTHTTYHPSNLSQAMARACLGDDPVAARAVRQELARHGARLTTQALAGRVPLSQEPEGGAFVFLDLREVTPDGEALAALLLRCLDAGVSLAPGAPFGDDFGRFARLCFTAVPPERLEVGLARVLEVAGG